MDDDNDPADADESHTVAGIDPAEAFAALGNPTRVEILEAFREHHLTNPTEQSVQFSTLRKAVGVRDSGQFRYHLEQLRDTFVEKCDGGYRLTYAGSKVINAIIAGTYTGRRSLGPITLESTCERCGTAVRASYRDGVLEVACENDHPLFLWSVPPNAAADRSLEAVVELATTLAFQSHELVADGTCSECYSAVESRLEVLDGADETDGETGRLVRFTARCEACAADWNAPAGFVLLGHPEVESLYHRLGRPITSHYWWDIELVSRTASTTVLETDPLRVRLSVGIDGVTLTATIDESAHILELDVSPEPEWTR